MRLLACNSLALGVVIQLAAMAAMAADARIDVTGTIAASPCKVSVGPIQLGDVSQSNFQGPGHVASGSVQSTQLRLSDCPYGLSRISYRVVPSNGTIDAARGIAKLDAQSTATGVAVQLTRDPDGAVPLNQDTLWTRYIPNDPNNSNNYLALKASYYQTSDIIGEGSANASFTITFSFQ